MKNHKILKRPSATSGGGQPFRSLAIDPEELRKDSQLKDEEGFTWTIIEIYNKKMVPEMFEIECGDLMANKYIRVSELCDYVLVEKAGE